MHRLACDRTAFGSSADPRELPFMPEWNSGQPQPLLGGRQSGVLMLW